MRNMGALNWKKKKKDTNKVALNKLTVWTSLVCKNDTVPESHVLHHSLSSARKLQ